MANAIFVWSVARALGGRVLLRIEDHDRDRSRPAFEGAILDDLDWLGFVPDEPSTDAFRSGPCGGRQSDREPIYESMLAGLRDRGLVYACDCTRAAIAAADGGSAGELRYPGTCAGRALAEGPGRGLRVRLAPSIERFVDLQQGPQVQRPTEQCGDLLVKDRNGCWSYQFAATVDDFVQGVTHVIRGDDLLSSTGRQIALARLLGRPDPPVFLHHALIMKSPTQKLSKSDRDSGVRDLRTAGWSAEDVIGEAAFRVGLIARQRPVRPGELSHLLPSSILPPS